MISKNNTRILFKLNKESHLKLKLKALNQNISISKYVENLVIKDLEKGDMDNEF
jgi:predicted HicB family RNase H-like nuclease